MSVDIRKNHGMQQLGWMAIIDTKQETAVPDQNSRISFTSFGLLPEGLKVITLDQQASSPRAIHLIYDPQRIEAVVEDNGDPQKLLDAANIIRSLRGTAFTGQVNTDQGPIHRLVALQPIPPKPTP